MSDFPYLSDIDKLPFDKLTKDWLKEIIKTGDKYVESENDDYDTFDMATRGSLVEYQDRIRKETKDKGKQLAVRGRALIEKIEKDIKNKEQEIELIRWLSKATEDDFVNDNNGYREQVNSTVGFFKQYIVR